MIRKIIHIDMDAFYASVEIRDNPEIKNLPVAVGGDPKKRGVIATANYIARKFGIRSAMPSWKAKKLCPDLLIIFPNFEKYKRESEAIHDIFRSYTQVIEFLSLDEAYLDVTDVDACQGSATLIAKEIRQRIFEERQLTASAGVAQNKFLAKVASEWNKPNGFFVIPPEDVVNFVKQLPIEKIPGVGIVMARKLHGLNIYTCEDLQQLNISYLHHHFGNRAQNLFELCRGIDSSPVIPERIRKSLSVETTFEHDLMSLDQCIAQIPQLFQRLMNQYDKIKAQYFIRKPYVKIKFSDFKSTTVESAHFLTPSIESYKQLIKIGWERRKSPVRLLGLGINLAVEGNRQLLLFEPGIVS